VLEEESLGPETQKYPRPFLLNIKFPGIKVGGISCDRDYSVAVENPDNIVLRLFLEQYESALLIIPAGKNM